MDKEKLRVRMVQRAERLLRRADQPRFQMSLIVGVTGAIGFVASYALLNAGVISMAVRYPLAIAFAYLAFLGLLRVWLRYQGHRFVHGADLVDVTVPAGDLGGGGSAAPDVFVGEGGQFGGAGATASFDAPSSAAPAHLSSGTSSGSSSGGFSFDLDLDDLGLVLLVIAMALCAALAGLYIIYIAPGLLAEMLVDSALVAGLYKRLKKEDSQHWIATAVRRTWLPVSGLAIVCAVGGHFFQKIAPEAKSIGYLFR